MFFKTMPRYWDDRTRKATVRRTTAAFVIHAKLGQSVKTENERRGEIKDSGR